MKKSAEKKGVLALWIAAGSLTVSVIALAMGEVRERSRSALNSQRELAIAVMIGEESARLSRLVGSEYSVDKNGKWTKQREADPSYESSVSMIDALLESCDVTPFTANFVRPEDPMSNSSAKHFTFFNGNFESVLQMIKGTAFTDHYRIANYVQTLCYHEQVTFVRSFQPSDKVLLHYNFATPDPEYWDFMLGSVNAVLRRLGKPPLTESGNDPIEVRYKQLVNTYLSIVSGTSMP